MQEFEIELEIGQPVFIAGCMITVLDAGDGEAEIEIENDGESRTVTLQSLRDVLLQTL